MAVGSFSSETAVQVPGLVSVGTSWPRKKLRVPEPTCGTSGMMALVLAEGLTRPTFSVLEAVAATVRVTELVPTLATVSPVGMPVPWTTQPTLDAVGWGSEEGKVTVVVLFVTAFSSQTPLIRGSFQVMQLPVLAA